MFRRLRGFAIPVVLLGLCAPAGAAGAGGADAGTLLAKHRAFVGWQLGDGTFTTLRLTRRKGTGESVTERTTELRIGLIYHNTSTYPKRGDTVEEDGFTGRVFWSSNINGFTTPIYGDSAKFRLSYALLMNEGTTTLQGVDRGPATIDGKQVETVRLEVPNADPIEVAIDPQSGAYVRAVVDPDGDYETAVHILSYTEVRPGKRAIASYRLGDESADTYTYTAIEPNVPVANAQLHPPDARATWTFGNPAPFPVTLTPTRLLVDATVNGVKGRFILDTGASAIALDEGFADRAKVTKLNVTGSAVGLYGAQHTDMRRANSISLGGNTLSNVIVEAQDFTSGDYRGLDQKNYDGLLGYDLFAGATVRVDFQAVTMAIADPSAQHGDPPGLGVTTDTSGWVPTIPMTLNRTLAVKAMLDTGNPAAIVFGPDLLYKYHLRMARNVGVKVGFGSVECGNIDTLQIGPITYYGEAACKLDSALVAGRRMLVGLDFLRHFAVTFDYPHGRLFLQPSPR